MVVIPLSIGVHPLLYNGGKSSIDGGNTSVNSKSLLLMLGSNNQLIGLGENYRKIPYFMGKSMVSCRFSLKSTH